MNRSEIARRHYLKNRDYYRAAQRLKRQRMREWLRDVKSQPCSDCHQSYPYYVMDFDHRDGVDKVADVNALVKDTAWAKVRLEIAKCELVCANCHRVRTHRRRAGGLSQGHGAAT